MSIVEKAAQRLQREKGREQPTNRTSNTEQAAETGERRPTAVERSVSRKTPEPRRAEHAGEPAAGGAVTLDWASLRRSGVVPPKSMSAQLGREFQRIKRPILAALNPNDGTALPNANRLMVTSAHPGDGKTFMSMNLAMSLAREMDHSVLLVDGDVAKPGVSRSLGVSDRPGLMDLLEDSDAAVEDAMVATDVPNLYVLPSGQRSEEAAERLASRRMASIVAELAADPTRIVIFDSPPLLATAEAQSLALSMGQILLVVRAGGTERRALDSALSLIEPANAAISLVLNQTRKGFGEDYDGYYGVYSGEGEKFG